jgi:hypothetical protein
MSERRRTRVDPERGDGGSVRPSTCDPGWNDHSIRIHVADVTVDFNSLSGTDHEWNTHTRTHGQI